MDSLRIHLAGDARFTVDAHAEGMKVMTLNLAHGRNRALHQVLVPKKKLEANLQKIAAALRREKPDVVALQEAEGPSGRSNDQDHVEIIRKQSAMAHSFRGEHGGAEGSSVKASTGTAILSQHPMREVTDHPFNLSWRDDKGFVRAKVDAPGMPNLEVISVHLDYIRPAMRRRQARRLIEQLGPRKGPRIVMGDLNTGFKGSESCVISMLASGLDLHIWQPGGGAKTFPAMFPARRLDWILASPEIRFRSCHTMPDQVSDHLGVVADIELA